MLPGTPIILNETVMISHPYVVRSNGHDVIEHQRVVIYLRWHVPNEDHVWVYDPFLMSVRHMEAKELRMLDGASLMRIDSIADMDWKELFPKNVILGNDWSLHIAKLPDDVAITPDNIEKVQQAISAAKLVLTKMHEINIAGGIEVIPVG